MLADMGSGLSSNQQQSRLAEITNAELGVQVLNTQLMLSYKLECNPY